jgi:hypothetical protein
MMFPLRLAACLLTLTFLVSAKADVKLIAVGSVPGDATDRSGLTDVLSDGTPHNRLGGMGSAIAYTGAGNRYVMAPDRGPGDGTPKYKLRYHVMEIGVLPGDKPEVKIELLSTTLLRTEEGKHFIGAYDEFDAQDPAKTLRLDPEGVRVGRNGNLFISDEYGPYLGEFGLDGKRIRSLNVPKKFLIAKPAAKSKLELPPANTSGRLANKSMEGLAISPDGSRLFGLMQCPLLQDGALDSANERVGVNNRLLEVALATGKTREFVYKLERPKTSVCEITAVNDHEFLVLERDGGGEGKGRDKKIYWIDIAGATDVSEVPALPSRELPDSIKPVKKKLFIDMMDPKFKLTGPLFPHKPEGMTFGPDLPDGRHLLLLTTDNDFIVKDPTLVFAFAIDAADLPSYQAQQFDVKQTAPRK